MLVAPGTSAGGFMRGGVGEVPVAPASSTAAIYGLIRDGKHAEAVAALQLQLQSFPRSRAALSLLGHCHFALADFRAGAACYEELCRFYPEVDSYRLAYAQCLAKAGLHAEAGRAASRVDAGALAGRVLTLQASIAYEAGDLAAARSLLQRCAPNDSDARVNNACIAFKEGAIGAALTSFEDSIKGGGWAPDLAYNVALCHYALKNNASALRCCGEVIARGIHEHPELSVGSGSGGSSGGDGGARSVGNTPALRETHLVEAFNLKAAVELRDHLLEAARESLADMPPRGEDELDPVTLHNSALASVDTSPSTSFRKLNFLLSHPPFPPEAFGNLLLLYVRYGCVDLAADALAENAHLTFRFLPPPLFEFLDATLMASHSGEEAYRRFDALATRHVEALRRHTKAIQDARVSHDSDGMKSALSAYDAALEGYVPVLLGQAKLYWDHDNYGAVERVLRQAAEFASEHDAWRLGMAHAVFMQGGAAAGGAGAPEKYREAIRHYEPIVRKHLVTAGEGGEAGAGAGGSTGPSGSSVLDVTAIVLANLCVSYIMTSANEAAEEVMRAVEKAEEVRLASQAAATAAAVAAGRPPPVHAPIFHLCIINLVIGTLYCAKGNTEFGVSRVLRALEPPARKLGADTWYYAKRALLHLAGHLSKGMLTVKDATFTDVLAALDAAELHGKSMPAVIAPPAAAAGGEPDAPPRTIAAEARMLKKLFLQLREHV